MSFPSYPAYKDSSVEWLGEVPQNWSVHSLKRTVDGCVNGLWGDEPDGENDIAVIRVADFERSFSTVGLDKLTYRSITPKERQSRLIKSGDLLIEKSGGGEKTLVGCVVLFTHGVDAITSNFVARMRPLPEFDSQFLSYAFGNLYHGRVNYPSVKQVTGIQNLDAESYLQERFCFPTRVEQIQIARFLDHETARIDALIEEQQRLIELLKEKRQSVISHAVTKGLDPTVPMKDSGVEWLGEVPAHWICKSYRYASVIYRGKFSHRPRNDPSLYDGDFAFIQTGDIARADKYIRDYKQTLNEKGAAVSQKFPAETLVMAIAANVGDTAILGFEAYAPDSVVGFKPEKNIELEFLRFSLIAALQELKKTSTQSTQANLNIDRISGIQSVFPPAAEQVEISVYLNGLMEQFSLLEQQAMASIKLMNERRFALISAAVTGKIDVRNWQSPASAPTPESAQEAV